MLSNARKEAISFIKTLFSAIILALIIRSLIFEPFHIPSGSMKPNLLAGDYIIVTKYSYGYSRFSFPFGINFFSGRVFFNEPKRGDVAVFKLPSNTSINYIKRLIGLPGDKIQMIGGALHINGQAVPKALSNTPDFFDDEQNRVFEKKEFTEELDTKTIETLDLYDDMPQDNTEVFEVPDGYYFMMGDNRDNSQDSRFTDELGFVPQENLVGKARIIFFSSKKPVWQLWNLPYSARFNRIFAKIN
jgi:signal peptidase I